MRISPRIFIKNRNGPNGIIRGLGETDPCTVEKPYVENLVALSFLHEVAVSRDLDLQADEVGRVVDPGGGEDGNDRGEAAQRRQRHRRAFLILDALDVRRYHALKRRGKPS